jgi:hypothetical protein
VADHLAACDPQPGRNRQRCRAVSCFSTNMPSGQRTLPYGPSAGDA